MITKLSTAGISWYIYIPKTLFQLTRIEPKTSKVLLTFKKNVLYITKISDKEIEKLENPLIKKFTKKGTGYGLTLTLPVIKLLNIDPEIDNIDIDIEDETLIIKKA